MYCAISSIQLSNGIQKIDASLFIGCSYLGSVTLPDTIERISGLSFSHCKSLYRITYKGKTSQWNEITKDPYWDNETGNYSIYCTDGTISK